MMHARVLAFTLVVALGACAEMRWTKAGADPAAVSRDLDECRASALGRAPAQSAGGLSRNTQAIEGTAAPLGTRAPGSSNERFIAEHEDVRLCMVRRGYQLKPAS